MWPWSVSSRQGLSESLAINSERAERWSNAARQSAAAIAAKAGTSAAMMGAARSWWGARRGSSDGSVSLSSPLSGSTVSAPPPSTSAVNSGTTRTLDSIMSRSMSENAVASPISLEKKLGSGLGDEQVIEPLSAETTESKPEDTDSDEFEEEDIPLKW